MAPRPRFASVLAAAREAESFPAGATIFEEGEPGDRMYLVKDGALSVAIDGKEVTTLRDGDIFGEMALIDNSLRSATVTVTGDCTLVPLDRKRFLFMVQETPSFALDVLEVVAHRLREIKHPL